jgi:hypothetical protein
MVYVVFPLVLLVVIGAILAGTLTSGSAKKTKAAIRLVSKSCLVIVKLYWSKSQVFAVSDQKNSSIPTMSTLSVISTSSATPNRPRLPLE